jgi:5-methyltetrahydrofolate--homocysteine methyltransferase
MAMQQEPPPFLIGERCNAQGSRKFKRLLLAEEYDTILEVGREQVEGGAHALDISVAVTERADEAELMRHVVKKLASRVLASTPPSRKYKCLERPPGALPALTHLEGGRPAPPGVLALAKARNARCWC